MADAVRCLVEDRREERGLEPKFGDGYRQYRAPGRRYL